MNILPSEQKKRTKVAIKYFEDNGELSIYEPCDCGSRIRHNNGGNYHEIIRLIRDEDQVFIKHDTTCELVPDAEWYECQDWKKVIKDYADWLS
jgi:hypothetical protein